jgi:hypothetical protein
MPRDGTFDASRAQRLEGLYYTDLYYTGLYYTDLYYTGLYYTDLYYTGLFDENAQEQLLSLSAHLGHSAPRNTAPV